MAGEPQAPTHPIGNLDIAYDPGTGQVRRVFDRSLDMEVIRFAPGHELEINHRPLPTTLVSQDDHLPHIPAWQCMLRSNIYPGIGLGQGLGIFRQMVVGSVDNPGGNHINPPNAMHLRYRLDREAIDRYDTPDPQAASRRPMKAPLWLDTVGTLCGRTGWFGPDTQMLAAHVSGCGPRSHVSLEEGGVRDVVPHLWNMFRRTHPGVQTIPGAVYSHPDGRWLWVTCQRPSVGMHWDWAPDGQTARFQFHARLAPSEIVHVPEVGLYWGRGGRDEMMARLNEGFIAYEEPNDWWWHTTWFWLHWWQYRPRGYDDMAEQVKYLHGELGLTGFGLTSHDVRPGSFDCAASGLRPSPHVGGHQGLRRLGQTVRELGGRMYVWLPFLGLAAPSLDLKDSWRITGDDGRPFESFAIGAYDLYHAVNFNHPEVQAYYLRWIRRYVTEYGIEGIFWDCGGSPLPADFSPPAARPFQRFPAEAMVAAYAFMEKVLEVGRQCSPDFFMWHEGFSTDLPATGYSSHAGADAFLMALARAGRKRLVFRSGSTYNLYGRFPRISPGTDTAFASPVSIAKTYAPVAADPMNRWLVRFVREHGVRDAVGLCPGASLCAGHVVVDPVREGKRRVEVPAWAGTWRRLTNVLTGEAAAPAGRSDAGTTFLLDGRTAYAVGE
jgi:hypothetical protein